MTKKSMLSFCSIIGLQISLLTAPALADEFLNTSQKMCEKVLSCSMAKMGDVPQSVRDMMIKSTKNMCPSMVAQYTPNDAKSHLKPAAMKCMKSVINLSCTNLEKMEDNPTAECKTLEKMAEEK